MNEKPLNRVETEQPGFSFAVREYDDAHNPLRYAVQSPWINGELPYLVERRIERSMALSDLLPEGFHVERSVADDDLVAITARDSETVLFMEARKYATSYKIAALTQDAATRVDQLLQANAKRVPQSERVEIRLWNNKKDDRYEDRELLAPSWEKISNNYPPSVRAELATLFELTSAPDKTGKLILWHGEPGTGKTTAIRALARAWEPWCAVQYISDPEQLFSDSGYLSEVLRMSARGAKGPTFNSPSTPDDTWRLIVAEDTDDYLRANAREQAGAALGRVLNLSDGILGQDRNVLLLLTTNEELNRLHPAIVRPGRCLAKISFDRFSPAEAQQWLGDHFPKPKRRLTLGELLVKRGDIAAVTGSTEDDPLSLGAYL